MFLTSPLHSPLKCRPTSRDDPQMKTIIPAEETTTLLPADGPEPDPIWPRQSLSGLFHRLQLSHSETEITGKALDLCSNKVSTCHESMEDTREVAETINTSPTANQPICDITLKDMLISLCISLHADMMDCMRSFKAEVSELGES